LSSLNQHFFTLELRYLKNAFRNTISENQRDYFFLIPKGMIFIFHNFILFLEIFLPHRKSLHIVELNRILTILRTVDELGEGFPKIPQIDS
jgi:hypothetical protein